MTYTSVYDLCLLTYIPASAYPVLFVQIASHYVGGWLAEILPKKTIRVPFTKFSFSLNPGPWSAKGIFSGFQIGRHEIDTCRKCTCHCHCSVWCDFQCCMGPYIISPVVLRYEDSNGSVPILHVGNCIHWLCYGGIGSAVPALRPYICVRWHLLNDGIHY